MADLNHDEFTALNAATSNQRYFYTLSVLIDEGWLWALSSGGDWLWLDYGETRLIPVWPHAEMAMACAQPGMEAHPISAEDWLTQWLPRLQSTGEMVLIYSGPGIEGIVSTAEGIYDDLEGEQELRANPEALKEYMETMYEALLLSDEEGQPAPAPAGPGFAPGPQGLLPAPAVEEEAPGFSVTGPGAGAPSGPGTGTSPRQPATPQSPPVARPEPPRTVTPPPELPDEDDDDPIAPPPLF